VRRRDLVTAFAGSALGWPLATQAQQKAMPLIGYLGSSSPVPYESRLAEFRQGLGEAGYVEGQNVAIEYRWAEGRYDQLPALAADLVNRKVNLIAAGGGDFVAVAAKNATPTIPIVFVGGGDPVAVGLVASFARPGGNLTGASILVIELVSKRLELISELVPQARGIALLANPNNPNTQQMISEMQEAARTKGLQVHTLKAGAEADFETAFASLVQLQAAALVISSDPFFTGWIRQLVMLAAHHAVPAIYAFREFPAAGGLISYGPSIAAAYRQAGIYAGKILNGAKPADLPVVQPTKFELVINLKTAKALGLAVPQSLLARADEVIE
jgi:ABC-type uncharacterized transport system substrate-binding protein